MSWHVLLTEPNRERTAARHLELLGCESYLPVWSHAHRQRRGGGRRWQVFRRPLFPGYLFIQSRDDLYTLVRIAAGVRKRSCPFLASEGKPAEVSAGKIGEIQALEQMINQRRSERMKFRIGDKVLVRDGAFTGLRATVHMLTDPERVTLLLDFLGQRAKVHVGADQVEVAA